MCISDLLKQAQNGEYDTCKLCPWSPQHTNSVAFGVSCIEHGVDWQNGEKPISMVVLQDPAGTTPTHTGRLCAVHNADNPSDQTAQFDIKLWKATVSLDPISAETGEYMKKHYWTNAIMHGKSGGERNEQEQARRFCREILAKQIEYLSPKIIIAKGEMAVTSFYEIGLINMAWKKVSENFDNGAWHKKLHGWRGIEKEISIFCTYHTSISTINRNVANRYVEEITEPLLNQKMMDLPDRRAADELLAQYSNLNRTTDRGVRYLLNHWLDIGRVIRLKNQLENMIL